MKTLVVLTGPTGVGKTDLSIELAKAFNTDIVSCDSRQIFKEMRVGTAVPETHQLDAVKHHFIQSISVQDYYSAAEFEAEAIARIEELHKEKDVVIMTGGSMMYIDAVCKGIDDIPTIDPELRANLMQRYENEGLQSIRMELKRLDPEFYDIVDLQNAKRVLHAVEVCLMSGKTYTSLRTNSVKIRDFKIVKVCLNRDRTELYDRINLRVLKMMEEGLEEEAKSVLPFRDLPSLNTVGYKEMFGYFDGEYDVDFAIERIQANSRKYARKQLSWFRRDGKYTWFHPEEQKQEVIDFVKEEVQF